jgi:hypothetical protein
MVHITGRRGCLGNTADLSPSAFFLYSWISLLLCFFLPFSFIQQNWGDKGSILRNCPFVPFLIFFHRLPYSFCTILPYSLFLHSSFSLHCEMKEKNHVSVMLCFWTESWISLFSSNFIAAANNTFAFLCYTDKPDDCSKTK